MIWPNFFFKTKYYKKGFNHWEGIKDRTKKGFIIQLNLRCVEVLIVSVSMRQMQTFSWIDRDKYALQVKALRKEGY